MADTRSASSEVGSSSQKSSEATPEQEYFLYELETSDAGTIGLVLRAIYDRSDVTKFMSALERKIRQYDRDIEKLCSFHQQGFIGAIQELCGGMKKECDELKSDVNEIDVELQSSSKSLLQKTDEIVKYRRMQRNIAQSIDSIALCLPMLEKYAKLQEQMQQKRYYPALKTLEQLEHTYFPHLQHYRFVQLLINQIDQIREEIKTESYGEFKDFLENIRKVSGRVGEVALKHAAEHHEIRPIQRKNPLGTPGGGGAEDEEFSAQDIVDFSPVYRCCHIFSVLGDKSTFEEYYRQQRRQQANLVLKAPEKMTQTLDGYMKYFHEVIGFFVIEDHVLQTASGLVTRSYRDELWELALHHSTKTMNSHFGNCLDAEMMLKVKRMILLFVLTMKGYGFNVQAFYRVLQNFRDQYNEILMAQCCVQFEEILERDNYTPIVVNDETVYQEYIERFPVYHRSLDQEQFPKKFPFSEFVPALYEQVKRFIKGAYRFTEELALSQTEVDETVRRSTNVLLERLSGALKTYITKKRLSLVQLVQITINMGYLEKGCEALELYITKLIGVAQSTAHSVKIAQGASMFSDARSEVEQQIYDSLNAKIGEFVELATYDWELNEPSGRSSDYISDLITFMNSTFMSFSNLPLRLARAACMSSCKDLASRLLRLLNDADVKAISSGAIEQFNLDLIQCELLYSFADLRQLLDLLMESDWTNYLAEFGSDRSKYVRVNPLIVIALLEKLIEYDKKTSSLFSRSTKEKEKRKLLETVLKELKQKVG